MDTISVIRKELAARRGNWQHICARTGLSYWWLTKISRGCIAEPGLTKVEALQKYFESNPVDAGAAMAATSNIDAMRKDVA